jgi:4-hydroxybenzoate polyprenyltransferase
MVSWRFLDAHRTWQDWVVLGLGILIGLSPWLTGEAADRAVVVNAALIGVLVFVLAEIELVKLRRWPEIGQLVCGLWQTVSPYVFGYAGAGQLRYWHFILGAFVALLAMLELWQDRRLKEDDLAERER